MKKNNQENTVPAQETNTISDAATPAQDINAIDETFLAKITELTNDLQRTRADFENYRKQVEIQKENAAKTAKLSTVYKLLPLLDDLDRAFTTYSEQLTPLSKSLEKTLKDLNLIKIDSNIGTEFNPDLHEAITMEEGEGEKELISETLRPGYYYEQTVIRPAMVKVKRG